MSDSCCSVTPADTSGSSCPASGFEGKRVADRATVAALTKGRVPPKQEFRLCRDAECEVVYYGSAGTVLTLSDLSVQPGFKSGSDGLVCYCFLHSKADIRRQLGETGETDIFESIKDEVQAGNCACEVRNPSGKCCLGEVQEAIRVLEKELEVTA
ncbi:MAG: (2Fe-2S)-binding protein [Acidobacteria bacterium]|nr:(2Fe-2S)-binding protein [Acidobacteriota bacterium]